MPCWTPGSLATSSEVAILPQPGLLQRYAREEASTRGDQLAGRSGPATALNGGGWPRGRLSCTASGSRPPTSLVLVQHRRCRAGRAWCRPTTSTAGGWRRHWLLGDPAVRGGGGAPEDAWTLTDWFENLYLRSARGRALRRLAEHRLPWTDASFQPDAGLLARLIRAADRRRRAGVGLMTRSPEAAAAVSTTPPAPAMVVEGDFVPGVVTGESEAELGVDVDVFHVPEARWVAGSSLVVTSPCRCSVGGGGALLRFLRPARPAEIWAAQGGFLSANEDVDLTAYPDDTTRDIARAS